MPGAGWNIPLHSGGSSYTAQDIIVRRRGGGGGATATSAASGSSAAYTAIPRGTPGRVPIHFDPHLGPPVGKGAVGVAAKTPAPAPAPAPDHDALVAKTRLQERLIETLRAQVSVLEGEVRGARDGGAAPAAGTPPKKQPAGRGPNGPPSPLANRTPTRGRGSGGGGGTPTSGASSPAASAAHPTPRTLLKCAGRAHSASLDAAPVTPTRRVQLSPASTPKGSVGAGGADTTINTTAPCDITPRTKLKQKRVERGKSRSQSRSRSWSAGRGRGAVAANSELAAALIQRHGSLRAAWTNLQALCAPTFTATQKFHLSPRRSGGDELPSYLHPDALASFAAFQDAVAAYTGAVRTPLEEELRVLQTERARLEQVTAARRARHEAQVAALRAEVQRELREYDMLSRLAAERP